MVVDFRDVKPSGNASFWFNHDILGVDAGFNIERGRNGVGSHEPLYFPVLENSEKGWEIEGKFRIRV